jgi:hypothetical protein
MLTIAYVTSRADPKFEWFAASLKRELSANADMKLADIRVVIVDFWAMERAFEFDGLPVGFFNSFIHVTPKPTPWQGFFKQTKENYFAQSNARNTAICFAPDGYIAFVDDLSVLEQGWLKSVREAQTGEYIACGAYRKVFKLNFSGTGSASYVDNPAGHDPRWRSGSDYGTVPCNGNWMFGCSVAAPVQAFVEINGYPEACDGMGYEDCITGQVLQRRGYKFRYDRRMMTLESEEDHHVGKPMRREDPGQSPNDKSHAMLERYKYAQSFDNPFNLADMRRSILCGGEFPVPADGAVEWFTGKKLTELP